MTGVNIFVENGGRLSWTLAWSVSVDVDPNVQKKNSKFFSFFFREVTPGSPSPRKPHINTGIPSNTHSLSQQPLWGGFGVFPGGNRLATPYHPSLSARPPIPAAHSCVP